MNRLQAAEQFRRVVQLFAAQLTEAQAREVPSIYPAYEAGKLYAAGDYITDGTDTNGDPLLYKVAQGHTSAAEWPPASTPALYTPVSITAGGWPVWAPPTGAHDTYNTGDIAEHNGRLWKSNRDGNTSEPGTDQWWSIYEEV